MKAIICSLLLSLFLLLPAPALAQSRASQRMQAMGKGYNLANWLEAGWLGSGYPNPIEYRRAELEALAQIGFRTIRVPVIFEWIISDTAPYNVITDSKPFAIIDSVIIPVAEKYKLIVILDNHHGRDLTDATYAAALPRISGMWTFLTEKYRALPHDRYFFEVRNEPTYEITNEHLYTVQQAVIDSIRAHDADRTLIVGANWWNAGGSLASSTPYRDASNNIIYTFHNYDPFNFTHQGFSWSGLPLGPTFEYPSADADAINSLFAEVRAWADTNQVPVFLGEFGASWFADDISRCNYIHCLVDACDAHRFPWLYWDVKHADDAFGIFRAGVVRYDSLIDCFRDAMRIKTASVESLAVPKLPTLSVYPNPATNVVLVTSALPFQGATVTVVDMRGVRVFQQANVWGFARIDASALPEGVYGVIALQNGQASTSHFVRR